MTKIWRRLHGRSRVQVPPPLRGDLVDQAAARKPLQGNRKHLEQRADKK